MTGLEETQRQFAKAGSKLRAAVGKALAGITLEALQVARGGAPTQRSAEGVLAFGYGLAKHWNEHGSGSGMPRSMINAIDAVERDQGLFGDNGGRISTIIANTYYLGRFREEGFSGQVDVKAHTRRAKGRKSWGRTKAAKTLRKAMTSKQASVAGYTPRAMRLAYNSKGGQVAVDFHRRTHKVRQQVYFETAYDAVAPKFVPVMMAAVKEGMQP